MSVFRGVVGEANLRGSLRMRNLILEFLDHPQNHDGSTHVLDVLDLVSK